MSSLPEAGPVFAEALASPFQEAARPTRLLNRNIVLLWAGQFVSEVGSHAFFVAMMFWLKHETHSALWMGAMGALAKTPGLVLGPLAGVVADRYSRRSIMIVCDLLDGFLVLSLGLWLWFFPGQILVALIWLGVVCVVNEITNAFFLPAQKSALPDLVPPNRLAAANSLELCLQAVSGLSGSMLGSVCLAFAGAAAFFVFNGVSFLISALCLASICIPRRIVRGGGGGVAERRGRWIGDLKDGCRFILGNRGMLYCELGGLAYMFVAAVAGVMYPFYVEDVLGRSAEWFGYLVATSGLGVLNGMLLAGLRRCDGRARLMLVALALLGIAAGGAAFPLARQLWLVFGLTYAGGVAIGLTVIQMETLLQLAIPGELRGRVLSLLGTVRSAVFGLGLGAGGLLGEWLGQDVPRIYMLCGLSLLPVWALLLASPAARGYLGRSIGSDAEPEGQAQ